MLHGGALWADVLAFRTHLNLLETPLDWLAYAPYALTGRVVDLTTPREIWDAVDRGAFDPQPHFYKALDGKIPQPATYRRGEFPRGIDPNLPVLRQAVLDISLEVRAFVLNGEIRTASIYAVGGHALITTMPDGQDFTSLMELAHEASRTSCHATVMDFALTSEDQWVVLGQKAAWCSSIYMCDPTLAFDVIRESVTTESSPFTRDKLRVEG